MLVYITKTLKTSLNIKRAHKQKNATQTAKQKQRTVQAKTQNDNRVSTRISLRLIIQINQTRHTQHKRTKSTSAMKQNVKQFKHAAMQRAGSGTKGN